MTSRNPNRVIFYSLPTVWPGDPLAGVCLVVPDDEPPSLTSCDGMLVLRRRELAAVLRVWRRSDPAAKHTPRHQWLEASLLFSVRTSLADPAFVSGSAVLSE